MKSLSYILLACLLIVMYGCKEEDHPYVGYIMIERPVLEPGNGSSATVRADTDISSPIICEINESGAEWCQVSVNGKEITVTATQANPSTESVRETTVKVRCGYIVTEFTILQKFEGQQYLYHDWRHWTANGNNVQASDGGGYPSLFSAQRDGSFWHSQYSPSNATLPHRLTIDMKKELPVVMVEIGRRANGASNYGTVKTMEIYASTDNENYTLVGGFTFEIPWTAPNGTVVTSTTSELIPPYEQVMLSQTITARYMRMVITETNNTNGVAQVAYFRAYEKL